MVVAYQLELPGDLQAHDVFHVSLLRNVQQQLNPEGSLSLPSLSRVLPPEQNDEYSVFWGDGHGHEAGAPCSAAV